MTNRELYQVLDAWYPTALSCDWDNDGIMCLPNEISDVKRVLITLDVTKETIAYAIQNNFEVIISHHPFLFASLSSVDIAKPKGEVLCQLITAGISVFSLHTRMDAGQPGVNDALAKALQLSNIESIGAFVKTGLLPHPMPFDEFLQYLQTTLNTTHCIYSNGTKDTPIRRVAVCGGSGKDFVADAFASGADAYVTGELSYHTLIDYEDLPIALYACGHYQTEQPVCAMLYERLQKQFSNIHFEIHSQKHTF